MSYRDKILTYFFARDLIYDLLALRRFLGRIIGGTLAVLCFIVWNVQHPSDTWHPHRPFWSIPDAQIVDTYRQHPGYQDYADYIKEHHLLDKPAPRTWLAPGIAAMAAELPPPAANHPSSTTPLSRDEILQMILLTTDALSNAAPERGKVADRGSAHTEAWFRQTEALLNRLLALYKVAQ